MSEFGPLYVGRSLLRREDRRLLTGQGQFIDDLVLSRMLHAVLVRSPVAHARIRSLALARAARPHARSRRRRSVAIAAAGAAGQISLPRKWTSVMQHKFLNPQQPLLAHDKVRHVGKAVAVSVEGPRPLLRRYLPERGSSAKNATITLISARRRRLGRRPDAWTIQQA
jgi:aerobic carbon-monoxide dehydrogenase large subunit